MIASMVVFVIDVRYVSSVESEGHSPVAAHPHAPDSLAITLQLMQLEPWKRHISRLCRRIQSTKHDAEPLHVLALYTPRRTGFKELLQPFVLESDDRHGFSVTELVTA